MSKKILYIKWGGLGDHLQFSTLPEAFYNQGHETYISDSSDFRNPEIYDLVWGKNPFVKGKTNERANCGHKDNNGQLSWSYKDIPELSFHRNWEINFGIESSYDVNESKYPVIYYEPNKIEEYKNFVLVDINQSKDNNGLYNKNLIEEKILELTKKYDKVLFIKPKDYFKREDLIFDVSKLIQIETKSIFEYSDLINSCEEFMCLWSGSSVLSSAIKIKYHKNLTISCFLPKDIKIKKSSFFYDNINYIPYSE